MIGLSHVVTLTALLTGPPTGVSRRELLLKTGAGAAALVPALAAHAEYYGAPPPKASGVAYQEALQAAKEYKYAARPVAGNEGEAFKAAEKRRAEAKALLESGGKAKEETAAETMARLGLKAAS